MHITVKTWYELQYLTMQLSGYMNGPTESVFFTLFHGMEYIMHHTHKTIMYSRNKILKKMIFLFNVSSN